jgi:NADH:ubiquinone oxidoreductase subunit 3 (subunit A)
MNIYFWICLGLDAILCVAVLYSIITKSLNTSLLVGLIVFLLFTLVAGFYSLRLKALNQTGWSTLLASVPILIAITAIVLTYVALKGLSSRMF